MRLRTIFRLLLLLIVAGAASGFWLSAPERLPDEQMTAVTGHEADPARGERSFLIGGCASCHAAKGAKDEARLVLEGGRTFPTEFGTFVAPNISPDPDNGIGAWSLEEFANAMMRGVAPDGSHYYPAFPYGSYARMTPGDVADLWAYLKTLPPSTRANDEHEVGFPFNIRRGLGLWKLAFLPDPAEPVISVDGDELQRGRYMVEGPGHCGECHTPRDRFGGLDLSRWLAGAPNPEGKGRIPNITPGGKDTSKWSARISPTVSEVRVHAGLRHGRRLDGGRGREHVSALGRGSGGHRGLPDVGPDDRGRIGAVASRSVAAGPAALEIPTGAAASFRAPVARPMARVRGRPHADA